VIALDDVQDRTALKLAPKTCSVSLVAAPAPWHLLSGAENVLFNAN
jgi:hypothetical protein